MQRCSELALEIIENVPLITVQLFKFGNQVSLDVDDHQVIDLELMRCGLRKRGVFRTGRQPLSAGSEAARVAGG